MRGAGPGSNATVPQMKNYDSEAKPGQRRLVRARRSNRGKPSGTAIAVAYEPLWAFGTGHIPTAKQIVQMHAHIRNCFEVQALEHQEP